MIGFWSVFHVIVNLQDSISDLPFPKRKQPSFTCVWMVVSVGPKSLGVVPLTFSFLFSRSFQCTIDSLTPSSATVSNFVLLANAHVLFFTHPVFLTRPSQWQLCPDVSTIVPPPTCASTTCCCTGRLSSCSLRGLPPSRSRMLFRALITVLGLSSQTHPMARYILSAITS